MDYGIAANIRKLQISTGNHSWQLIEVVSKMPSNAR
jgi:hypothetical protein